MKKKEAILNMSDKAFDSAWDKACSKVEQSAYEAGLAEGRRRAYRALKRWSDGNRQCGKSSFDPHLCPEDINHWLASRSKARKVAKK